MGQWSLRAALWASLVGTNIICSLTGLKKSGAEMLPRHPSFLIGLSETNHGSLRNFTGKVLPTYVGMRDALERQLR